MKRDNKKFVRALTRASAIAALYVVLTLLSALLGLSSGAVQIRFSEALCLLPILFPEAVLGLTVGCALANLLTGCALLDIIFGSLATLLGCFFGRLIYLKFKVPLWLATLPTILSNMLIIPLLLIFTYGAFGSYFFFLLTIGIGESISAGIFGCLLLKELLKKRLK